MSPAEGCALHHFIPWTARNSRLCVCHQLRDTSGRHETQKPRDDWSQTARPKQTMKETIDHCTSEKPTPKNVRASRAVVRRCEPSVTAQVRFPDGSIYEGPIGTPLEDYIRVGMPEASAPIVAARVNGKLKELTCPITRDADVIPLSMSTSDGMRIYRRSLCFLLITAVNELFPGTRIVVDHSLTVGGLFCHVLKREHFTEDEVRQIEARMREIVAEDAPITKQRIPLSEAITGFQHRGWDDKVRLLRYREKDYLTVYTLRGEWDYFYGYMVPSTAYINRFRLRHYPPGLVLQFPLRSHPTELPEYRDFPKLAAMFREYGKWLKIVQVRDVGPLNEATESGRIREVILVTEALHEQRIARIAQDIAEQRDRVRLVVIAGPSSSGKTTFSKRLAIQLLAHGVHPFPLALDNYFVDRDRTPLDESGEYDFESLHALNLDLLNRQVLALMDCQEVTLPRYDFQTGKGERGQTVSLTPQHILLAEGLHGMNPELLPHISPERIYRIYASCLTQLNIDYHNRVPTTDTRLLRRMVRDAQNRGYSAQETIARWQSVRQGESRNIFPFQEFADAMFNSALVYELAVLKPFAEPLLRQVEPGTMEYIEARRLLAFLQWLLPCPPDNIPDNSILREFIGGSILRDYTPW